MTRTLMPQMAIAVLNSGYLRRRLTSFDSLTPMAMGSLPALLRERASLQPNRTAFTFMDYNREEAGNAESLTWSQLYRRALNIARELRLRGSSGDRAVILAPHGLDYIAAFLGALQAGFIAFKVDAGQGLDRFKFYTMRLQRLIE